MPGVVPSRGTLFALIVALSLLAAACAPAAAPSAPQAPNPPAAGSAPAAPAPAAANQRLQALIDGARQEGVRLELTHGTFNEPELLKALTDGFNRYYGLDLQLRNTPEPAINLGASKLLQEFQAERPASTDVFLSTEVHVLTLWDGGALEPQDWSWADNVRPELQAIIRRQ